mmetsp:Transcript_20537/g.41107  ORF Transcript_20537/g.41107 Transcript_20537/m.41107 type:complete len:338 (+) Transcript_20537:725-1738(+)
MLIPFLLPMHHILGLGAARAGTGGVLAPLVRWVVARVRPSCVFLGRRRPVDAVEQVEGGGVVVYLFHRVVGWGCGARAETPEHLARVHIGGSGVAAVGGALAVERQIEGVVVGGGEGVAVAGGGGPGVGRPVCRDGDLVAVPIQRDVEGRVRQRRAPRPRGAVEGRGDGGVPVEVPVEAGRGGPVGRQVQRLPLRPGQLRPVIVEAVVVVEAVVAAAVVVVAVVDEVVVEPAARQVVARVGGVVRSVVEGARLLLGVGGAVIRGRRNLPGLEAVEFVGAVREERTAPAETTVAGGRRLHAESGGEEQRRGGQLIKSSVLYGGGGGHADIPSKEERKK